MSCSSTSASPTGSIRASSASGRGSRPCAGSRSSCDAPRRAQASAPVAPGRPAALASRQVLDNWIVAVRESHRGLPQVSSSDAGRPTTRISVVCTLECSDLRAVPFRGEFPAASLKRAPHGRRRILLRAFRGEFPAASLKPERVAGYSWAPSCLSAGNSPRPH